MTTKQKDSKEVRGARLDGFERGDAVGYLRAMKELMELTEVHLFLRMGSASKREAATRKRAIEDAVAYLDIRHEQRKKSRAALREFIAKMRKEAEKATKRTS